MATFLAMTSRGLVDVLDQELSDLGFKKREKSPSGVYFESNWQGCYRANIRLRTATRVVMPILDFVAYNQDELYRQAMRHDYTKYIDASGTIAVEAHVRDSDVFRDQRFVTMKIKDAVVDQFREKFGSRPDVDTKDPDLRIVVRLVRNDVSIAIDTSGEALYKRGYRSATGEAPLKEHLAAGLILSTGWKGDVPILDPMCGSGTLLIEAAMIALNMAPGTLRREFGFQRLRNFNSELFDEELNEAHAMEKEDIDFQFYGYDLDRKVIAAAKENAKAAGVGKCIQFHRQAFELLEKPCEDGMIVVNPPYGERLGDRELLMDLYKDFAFLMKSQFKGWTFWILSGNPELSAALKLKAERKMPVYNGSIECRFLKYSVF